MKDKRFHHTASVLKNGPASLPSGLKFVTPRSVELYDPLTETLTITDNMNNTQYCHTVSLLTNGKVLVTGGSYSTVFHSSKLYY
jgi:hypothetical protein